MLYLNYVQIKTTHINIMSKYGFGWLYRDFFTCGNTFCRILCVRGIDYASVSTIFLLDFETIVMMWYFLFFIYLHKLSNSFWLFEMWKKNLLKIHWAIQNKTLKEWYMDFSWYKILSFTSNMSCTIPRIYYWLKYKKNVCKSTRNCH